jgi:hypothetical protein
MWKSRSDFQELWDYVSPEVDDILIVKTEVDSLCH